MKPKSPEEQLIQARELYYSDWDAAIAMYRSLVKTLPIGEFWAAAQIDLAMREYGTANFESAVRLTQAVLSIVTTSGCQHSLYPGRTLLVQRIQCHIVESLSLFVEVKGTLAIAKFALG